MFIKNIVMAQSSPLKVKYYGFKVEFQSRGSPHVHGTLWIDFESEVLRDAFKHIKNGQAITTREEEELIQFADQYVSCSKYSPLTREIVQEVNEHSHTKACRKYGGTKCRFDFPRFPTLRTLISSPVKVLKKSEREIEETLKTSKNVLKKVKVVLEDDEVMKKTNRILERQYKNIQEMKKSVSLLNLLLEEDKEPICLEKRTNI